MNDANIGNSLSGSTMTPAVVRDKLFDPVMTARDVNVNYGDKCAVRNVSLDIGRNQVLALIGPSGPGNVFTRPLSLIPAVAGGDSLVTVLIPHLRAIFIAF